MKLLNEDMGYVYISEQTSPEENYVKEMRVHDKNGIFFVEFDSCVHSFDVMNRNSRMYEAANIEECMQTERIQHYLSHGGWYGEMDHPTQKEKDHPLSPERIQLIDMSNTSHRLLNPHVEGNLLISKVQTDAGTDAGMNLARKMVQGFIPGFSCRAIATMMLKAGKPVVRVRKIICYDWVLYQSHREAEQVKTAPTKFIQKDIPINESVEDYSNVTSVAIMIPLTEILTNVGHSDPNAQTIMEAFDLHDDDIMGFSKNKKHLILRDNNNMIYCNIDMNSRNKINDYLRSFDK